MKKLLLAGYMIVSVFIFSSKAQVYKDPSKTADERVNDLVSRLTLEEKIQLIGGDSTGFDTHPIARLGVPAIRITDGPMGVRNGHATSFPSGVATAATWDTLLTGEIARAMALETKAKGRHYLLGPCVCIQRMPLGGRNFETYSEDPFLASRLGVNWIKALQSEKVIASVKHFATNDQEWERNNYDVKVDERTLREVHLLPFEAAVKEADSWSVMSAYNIQNGQHCSENYHLLSDVLKKEWGFKGFVISDWVSVYSTVNAANAGLDLEMPRDVYFRKDSILKYLKEGKITEETINDKVRRIMRAAFLTGMFDSAEKADTSVLHSSAHKELALKSAQKAITLLKNEDGILPLNLSKVKTIAVIGPNAASTPIGGGGSSYVNPYYSVSALEGLQKRMGDTVKILYSMGDSFPRPDVRIISTDLLFTPDKLSNGLKGEYFDNMELAGEPKWVNNDEKIDFSFRRKRPGNVIPREKFSVRWSGWLKPKESGDFVVGTMSDDGVKLYIDDKLVINNWTTHGASLDEYSLKLEAGKEYKIRLEYFQDGGGAQIKLGMKPKTVEQLDAIKLAAETAAKADVVIVFAGSSDRIESEGIDRESLELPLKQELLIKEILKKNKNTIVVLNGGTAMNVAPWLNDAKALLDIYYLGQETGNAIASVLTGDVNPSGKLPFSFIADTTQSPAFKGYKDKSLKINYSEGVFVGYRFLEQHNLKPIFPFGFGLSYTSFKYSDMKVSQVGDKLYEVTLYVTNVGKRSGEEVVQLYISDKEASVARPLKELKGFSKVSLKVGETKKVRLRLNARDFAFWDVISNNWKVEPGDFEILVGSSSADILQKETIQIK